MKKTNESKTTSISIDARSVATAIKSLCPFVAGDKDPRYYLKGISLNCADNILTLEATNGHLAGQIKLKLDSWSGDNSSNIMPIGFCKDFARLAIQRTSGTLDINLSDGIIEYTYKAQTAKFASIDAKYPDLKGIFTGSSSGNKANGINAEYLQILSNAAKLLTPKSNYHAVRFTDSDDKVTLDVKGNGALISAKLIAAKLEM